MKAPLFGDNLARRIVAAAKNPASADTIGNCGLDALHDGATAATICGAILFSYFPLAFPKNFSPDRFGQFFGNARAK